MRSRVAVFGALSALVIVVAGANAAGSGSVSLTTAGVAYTQNFDTLASATGTAHTALPTGWYLAESGTSARNNDAYAVSTGSDTSGDVYSFGSAGSSERAYGTLFSGTLTPIIGASFTNNTGGTISALDIAYTGEMWRAGVTNRGAADRLDFQLSTNATSLTTGTWTDHDALDFSSPNINTTAGALDGNAAGNRSQVSSTITGLSIPNGATFWIRWTDFDIAPGADDGLAVDDFSLTPTVADATVNLSINDVAMTEGNSGTKSFDFTVSLSEPAGAGGVTFDIATADGTATAPSDYTAKSLTGQTIPAGSATYSFSVLVNGDTAAEQDETFFVNVNNVSGATVARGQGIGTILNDDCGPEFTTPIYEIQGSGPVTPLLNQPVTTEGVVTGDFEGTAAASGFYMQDVTGDGDPATSDGIFVFTGNADLVSAGQVVRVSGFARERFNQTAITGATLATPVAASGVVDCETTTSVLPTDVTLPFATLDFPERYEGMLVRLPQSLVIAEYFNYDRFGEMVLGLPLEGESRPFTPTSIDEPGGPALARLLANQLRRITLDDVQSAQNPPVLRHPNGQPFSLANRFRGGDLVQNTVGVLGWDFNLYRIFPTGPADYTAVNHRPEAPDDVGGRLKVAAFNTLNFFLTADIEPNTTPPHPDDNKCGPARTLECRGWDSNRPEEFERQRTKLLAALVGLDADVVGLNELENTAGVDPLDDPGGLVPGLNDLLGEGTYASIQTGTIGTDAIKVGLIYKPAKVMPVGDFKLLDSSVDPRFIDRRSRPMLTQTFEEIATGARFTVAVNHLKSKGSACTTADGHFNDPDLGDGQGNCNLTRKQAAEAMVDWLATDPTGSGDPDFLITGDLNSYAKEDPIDVLLAGGYTNLIEQFLGTYAYSFVFDGMAGYLDHALSSQTLTGQVTGATEWHINADEPDILDYDTSFKPPAQAALYEPNAFRSSDHDPVLVGLALTVSFDDLCRLTQRLVTNAGVADALCAKLAAAKAADARGNTTARDGSLGAYRNQIDAQTGKSISAADAAQLKALSLTLQ